MNTKLIMILCGLFLAIIGISLTFLPDEISKQIGISSTKSFQLILQILGALYFSFAMLNWMAKGSIIGGIYNRPITVANFTHFVIGVLALIKGLMDDPALPYVFWILASVYSIFAWLFGVILFRHPVNSKRA